MAFDCGTPWNFLLTFMVHETTDSIPVKKSRVELFHPNCIISQSYFYHKFMISYTLTIYDYLLVLRFLSPKHQAST